MHRRRMLAGMVTITCGTVCYGQLTSVTPQAAPTPAHPIIDAVSGYLLGASAGGKWVQANVVARSMPGGEKYRLYDLHGLAGDGSGTKPATQGPPCDDTFFVKLTPLSKPLAAYPGTVGLVGNWNAQPRVPRAQAVDQPVYRRAVAALLAQHGIRHPVVKIEQLLRVDLDGDKQDEVLITATNCAGPPHGISPDARAGDYSFVMLRRMVGGKLRTQLLDSEFHPHASKFSAPNRFDVAGLLDLNGDGRMEIVLHSQYYEGDGTTVLSEQNGQYREVLASGCGA